MSNLHKSDSGWKSFGEKSKRRQNSGGDSARGVGFSTREAAFKLSGKSRMHFEASKRDS